MSIAEKIIWICGAIITVSGAMGILHRITKKSLEKTIVSVLKENSKSYTETIQNRFEELENELAEFIRSQSGVNEQTSKAMLAILRDSLNQSHNYYIRKGFVGTHSLYIIEELYKVYKDLGGNTFIDDQVQELRKLKVRSAEIDQDYVGKANI